MRFLNFRMKDLREIVTAEQQQSDMHRTIVVLYSGQHYTCEGLSGGARRKINYRTAIGMNDNRNMNKAEQCENQDPKFISI
jgi:hypothetical protein